MDLSETTWNTMLGYHLVSTPAPSCELDCLVRDLKAMSDQSGSGSWGSPRTEEYDTRWRGSSDDDEAPPLLSESETEHFPPSCDHNKWDNLRTKHEIVALRCRVCSSQWKVPVDYIRSRKCDKFVKSCPVENCPYLHIFKYKLPVKTRSKLRQTMEKAREQQRTRNSAPAS